MPDLVANNWDCTDLLVNASVFILAKPNILIILSGSSSLGLGTVKITAVQWGLIDSDLRCYNVLEASH